MRTRILSFAITLIALISFGNAYAQRPHFNPNETQTVSITCQQQGANTVYLVSISGTVHGIGNARTGAIKYVYDANFNCYNRGNSPGPVPGQSGPVTGVLKNIELTTIRPGVATYSGSFTVGSSCRGNALRSVVTDLDFSELSLIIQGETLSLLEFLGAVPNCDAD
jgi:hypothetical protein